MHRPGDACDRKATTAMSTTAPTSAPSPDPHRGAPRWAWALIAFLAAVALVAVTVTVFALRGDEDRATPPPAGVTQAPSTTASASPSATGTAETVADGCLGGASELDQAVVTAQEQAPLTPAGAAAFTATLMRWAFASPPPPFQARTAKRILAKDATNAARDSLSGTENGEGTTVTLDFSDGRYYVEASTPTTAIVSFRATGHTTIEGAPQPAVLLGGSVHLRAVNGLWRYRDLTDERSLEDLERVGVPYPGGC